MGTVSVTDKNEISHAVKSLRKKTGDRITVINGKGVKALAEISSVSKKEIILEIIEILDSDTEYENTHLTVGISLLNKSSKMKLLVEKLTEIGVHRIVFFKSEYTAFPDKSLKDLELNAISALKQCGGTTIPEIITDKSLEGLACSGDYQNKYFAHFGGDREFTTEEGKNNLVLIGPEGGFSEKETEFLKENDFTSVSLGKRILRAETAAIVAAGRLLFN